MIPRVHLGRSTKAAWKQNHPVAVCQRPDFTRYRLLAPPLSGDDAARNSPRSGFEAGSWMNSVSSGLARRAAVFVG